jgi:peptide-methionine (S)-S-oxide reductase
MKRLLVLLPMIATPLLFSCLRRDETQTMNKPSSPPEAALPATLETATFALGWFWTPDAQFGSLPGVVRTRVGYAGGTKDHPTYYDLGDHSESIQVDYDPSQISFERLLAEFWSSPNSCERTGIRQYMSFIFYHNEEQRQAALASREREAAKRKQEIATPIVPADTFIVAEDYHQKYFLRQCRPLERELSARYASARDFMNSTTAMKLNAYLAGHRTRKMLDKEIDSFGLSEMGRTTLREAVGN